MDKVSKRRGLSRRSVIRMILFPTALVIVLAVYGISYYMLAKNYKAQLEYSYQASLEGLSDSIRTIDTELKKSVYATSPKQISEISNKLSRECSHAKTMIAALPSYELHLDKLNKFMSQVGNYSYSLSKSAANGNKIKSDDVNNLKKLSKNADSLYGSVSNMINTISTDGVLSTDLSSPTQDYKNSKSRSQVYSDISEVEESFDDYPSLIYDGPFSDNILTDSPMMTRNEQEITIYNAKQKASEYLGADRSKISYESETAGIMPSYKFSTADGTVAEVTKAGGYLIYLMRTGSAGAETVTDEKAERIAMDYVKKIGYGDTASSYFTKYDGIMTVNLAYKEGGVVYYTDLIKVSVSLDSGKIQMVDARGYIMNHHGRTKAASKIGISDAEKNLSPLLTVVSSRECAIPNDSRGEIPCYEFTCKGENNEDILVYVNRQNGTEENIMFVIHTSGGSLAM